MNKLRFTTAAALSALSLAALSGTASAQGMMAQGGGMMSGGMAASDGHYVRITIDNLTTGQGFSPSFFASHGADAAPLFKLGETATMPLWSVAEGGNIGGFSGAAAGEIGTKLADAVLAIHTPTGGHRSAFIWVDRDHPLVSGVWMLGMTNDGFSGIQSYDAYALTAPATIDLRAYDAGSEKNNEARGFLGALGEGNMRDPEDGVVTYHTGIRGDADAPATWQFDPNQPVARITFAPVGDAPGAM